MSTDWIPRPFTIDIPQSDLDDLRRRLGDTRWADDYANDDWAYGVESGWLHDMIDYWLETYDWRAHEAVMNSHQNFQVAIDDVVLHYLHAPGTGPAPMPLILTHGWPWTFWDMRDMIGPLTDPAAHGGDPADAFDVVIPSLPGYGFSNPLRTSGVDVARIADLWVILMREVLGYARFGAYGGDWGALITAELGHAHAEHLYGINLSMSILPGPRGRSFSADDWAPEESWMPARMAQMESKSRSHVTVQMSDPQTLAYALVDSPVGAAAWLWERRRAWSDCDGDVLSAFSRDDLITGAAIYWLTGTVSTSMRLYADQLRHPWALRHDRTPSVEAPTGFSIFPKDNLYLPKSFAARNANLHRWTVMPEGGHFAPAEQPALLVAELREFFRPLRS